MVLVRGGENKMIEGAGLETRAEERCQARSPEF
jgi:hypothetical protein